MTNAEKFATSEERVTAFREFCHRMRRCDKCPTVLDKKEPKSRFGFDLCALRWLTLEVCQEPEPKNAKLKPCPFCGGEAKFASQKWGLSFAYVKCSKCHAKVCVDKMELPGVPLELLSEMAISEWNRRAKL